MSEKKLKDLTKGQLIKEIKIRNDVIRLFSKEVLKLEELLKITGSFINGR